MSNYGRITSMSNDELALHTTKVGRTRAWRELYQDVRLRLEQTPDGYVLLIPFDDESLRESAAAALPRYAQIDFGRSGMFKTRKVTVDGKPHLAVKRGPNYKLNGNGHKE